MDLLRRLPKITAMGCGQLPESPCRHGSTVDILKRLMRPQPASGSNLSLIMSPEPIAPRTQIRLGTLAQGRLSRGPLGG
jgi:hypothetical protein